jgi:hypothetical protein
MQKGLVSRIKAWEKKGYELDNPFSLTREQALTRVAFLHYSGYKARIMKGHFSLYTVVREPFSWTKVKKSRRK